MISSAIWDKSVRVNFSKANQFAREKSCDFLLIIHIQKFLCKWMTNKTCSVAYLSESLLKHYGVSGFVNPDTATEF